MTGKLWQLPMKTGKRNWETMETVNLETVVTVARKIGQGNSRETLKRSLWVLLVRRNVTGLGNGSHY
jgi:hypothetical protein